MAKAPKASHQPARHARGRQIPDLGTAGKTPVRGLEGTRPALVLAVSGGPDSIALMWLAARWRRALARGPRLFAVTVDHGLRAESAREARDVKRLARSARSAASHDALDRRQAENRMCRPRRGRRAIVCWRRPRGPSGATHILTAHTRDDQAETLLMRLVARQRHRRSCGDGAADRARRRAAGASVSECFEIAARSRRSKRPRSASPTIRPIAT